jgi:hypothetical protein
MKLVPVEGSSSTCHHLLLGTSICSVLVVFPHVCFCLCRLRRVMVPVNTKLEKYEANLYPVASSGEESQYRTRLCQYVIVTFMMIVAPSRQYTAPQKKSRTFL